MKSWKIELCLASTAQLAVRHRNRAIMCENLPITSVKVLVVPKIDVSLGFPYGIVVVVVVVVGGKQIADTTVTN
jgi:hypothetical protein